MKHAGPGTLDFAVRSVRGGKRAVMDDLAPLATQFEPRLAPAVAKWQQLTPWQRRFVTLDDFAAETPLTASDPNPGNRYGGKVKTKRSVIS